MSRRKEPALPVPTTDEGAIELVTVYIDVERSIRAAAEVAKAKMDAAKAEFDTFVAGVAPEQKNRFAAIKSWWEAGGAERMAGKKRSADVAGAKIGTRLSTASVKLPKGVKVEAIVEWLLSLRWILASTFIRVKRELDKEAIIAAWPENAAVRSAFEGQGVTVVQTDQFFIDVTPLDTKEEARTDG